MLFTEMGQIGALGAEGLGVQCVTLVLCFSPCSDPEGHKAPALKPCVYLHHPGRLHGDCSGGWLRCLLGEVSGAAV